jgi:hypothetical protein
MDTIPTFFQVGDDFLCARRESVCKCVKNIWKYALSQNMHDGFCVF